MQKCILIIDDDDDTLQLTSIILERSDYRVETLDHCSDDLIEQVDKIKPDIILMDLRIPEIGGAEGTLRIKKDERYHTIPVILFSADKDIENVAIQVGAQGALQKPFDINSLRKIIREYLG
jgi:CheY-like chemotaxis protein